MLFRSLLVVSAVATSWANAVCVTDNRDLISPQVCATFKTKAQCDRGTQGDIQVSCKWTADKPKVKSSSVKGDIGTVQSFVCSDGQVYSAWLGSKNLSGNNFDGPQSHLFKAFCRASVFNQDLLKRSEDKNSGRAPALCMIDSNSSEATRSCFQEFQEKNLLGNQTKSAVIEHNPPKSWFSRMLADRGTDIDSNCASFSSRFHCGKDSKKILDPSQLFCIYGNSSHLESGWGQTNCRDVVNEAILQYATSQPHAVPSVNADR